MSIASSLFFPERWMRIKAGIWFGTVTSRYRENSVWIYPKRAPFSWQCEIELGAAL